VIDWLRRFGPTDPPPISDVLMLALAWPAQLSANRRFQKSARGPHERKGGRASLPLRNSIRVALATMRPTGALSSDCGEPAVCRPRSGDPSARGTWFRWSHPPSMSPGGSPKVGSWGS